MFSLVAAAVKKDRNAEHGSSALHGIQLVAIIRQARRWNG